MQQWGKLPDGTEARSKRMSVRTHPISWRHHSIEHGKVTGMQVSEFPRSFWKRQLNKLGIPLCLIKLSLKPVVRQPQGHSEAWLPHECRQVGGNLLPILHVVFAECGSIQSKLSYFMIRQLKFLQDLSRPLSNKRHDISDGRLGFFGKSGATMGPKDGWVATNYIDTDMHTIVFQFQSGVCEMIPQLRFQLPQAWFDILIGPSLGDTFNQKDGTLKNVTGTDSCWDCIGPVITWATLEIVKGGSTRLAASFRHEIMVKLDQRGTPHNTAHMSETSSF